MSSEKPSIPRSRRRKLCAEVEPATDFSLQPTSKRGKLEKHQRHRTASRFWDNLSRLWLTPRALREFDRRTVRSAAPAPPEWTGKEKFDLAQLKRFARHGGPSLCNLRGYSGPESAAPSSRTMDSSQSGSRKRAKTGRAPNAASNARRTSAYDPIFEQHLIDHGIYPHGYGHGDNDNGSVYPDNWEEIDEMLARPRRSLSPSRFPREAFLQFEKTNTEALSENTVMSKAFPIIAGTANIPSEQNILFGNLEDLTDGIIVQARPDFYDGSRPAELDQHIREKLGPYIVPSTNTTAPCLPNFFTEGKGPDGSPVVCMRQALYNGALGARGVHELRSYIGVERLYDNNSYTISSSYQSGSGTLRLDTIHPTPSTKPNRKYGFRMTKLGIWSMTHNSDAFRVGATAFRNARDWAKQKREELIAAANGKVPDTDGSGLGSSTQSFVSPSSNKPTHPGSETSSDELTLDDGTFASSNRKTSASVRTDPLPKVSNPRSKKGSHVNKGPVRRPETS
ncbi:hypothetical protein MMC22_010835 [Lobaria immixta]|nr:hypothetical protein [Lobaria immixta]